MRPSPMRWQSATAYRGRLFVIGTAWFEPDQRIFRATAMDVPEYPGDIPCDGDPQPKPVPDDASGPGIAPAAEETCFSQGVSDSVLPQTGDNGGVALIVIFASAGFALLLAARRRFA